MRRSTLRLALLEIFVSLVFVASSQAGDLFFEVPLGAEEFTISAFDLSCPYSSVFVHSSTSYGTLLPTMSDFVYRPTADFWLGMDSFRYSCGIDIGQPSTVYLTAQVFGFPALIDGFDTIDPFLTNGPWLTFGSVSQNTIAPIEGAADIRVDAGISDTYIESRDSVHRGGEKGDSADTLGICIGPQNLVLPFGQSLIVAEAETLEGADVRFRLESVTGGFEIHAEADGVSIGPVVIQGSSTPFVEAVWRPSSEVGVADGRFVLLENGRQMASAVDLAGFTPGTIATTRFGMIDAGPGVGGYLRFDEAQVGKEALDPVFVDGLEDGSVSSWSSTVGAGDVFDVTTMSPISGMAGLEVAVDSPHLPGYVTDTTPAAVAYYRTRFRLDLGSLALPQGQPFIVLGANGPVGEENRILVRLQAHNDKWLLQTDCKRDDGTLATVWWNTLDLSQSHHTIDVEWWAADQDGAESGTLLVTIDGFPRGSVVGVENWGQRIENVDFGARGIDSGAEGIFYLDDFISLTTIPEPPI